MRRTVVSMARFPLRRALLLAATALLTAGVAFGAYSLLGRREVTTSSAEAYRFYKLGRENELKMYYKEAMAAYAEALARDSHFVMATVRLAAHLRERDPERAKVLMDGISSYRESVTKREQLKIRLYEAMWEKKDPNEAESLVNEFVKQYPEDPDAYLERAQFHLKLDRPKEATADFETLLRLNPNYALAYNSLGYFSLAAGEYAKAEDYLKRYRFLAPDQANPYDSLGEFYATVGRYDEAEESLRKALQIKPDFFPAQGHLGTVAAGRGDARAAADHFRRAAELADSPGMRAEFGWLAAVVLANAGLRDEALKQIEGVEAPKPTEGASAADKNRAEARLLHRKAIFLALLGRADEAATVLGVLEPLLLERASETASEKESVARDLAAIRGLIAEARGRHAEAAEFLGKAIPVQLQSHGFGYLQGEPLRRTRWARNLALAGRTDEAEAAMRPVLARNPNFAPALAVAAEFRLKMPASAEGAASAAR